MVQPQKYGKMWTFYFRFGRPCLKRGIYFLKEGVYILKTSVIAPRFTKKSAALANNRRISQSFWSLGEIAISSNNTRLRRIEVEFVRTTVFEQHNTHHQPQRQVRSVSRKLKWIYSLLWSGFYKNFYKFDAVLFNCSWIFALSIWFHFKLSGFPVQIIPVA